MALALSIAVFMTIAGLAIMLILAFGVNRREELVRRRLESIGRAQQRGSITLESQLLRDELLSEVKPLNRLLMQMSWSRRLLDFSAQAGVRTRPGKLLLFCAVFGLASYLIAAKLLHNVPLGALCGTIGSLTPLAYLALKRMRRMREFEKHFPEAIDLLGRAVRAGHAFTTGMEMITKELPEPVAGEFRVTFEEQNFGLPLKDAMLNLTERVPIIDVQFFCTALLIQKETGGNLGEILDNLARVIRERFMILGEVRIRTAQGRLTAGILMALPPIMVLLLTLLNPGYTKPLFQDPWGPPMLLVAFTMQVIGSILLWKIVNIEV